MCHSFVNATAQSAEDCLPNNKTVCQGREADEEQANAVIAVSAEIAPLSQRLPALLPDLCCGLSTLLDRFASLPAPGNRVNHLGRIVRCTDCLSLPLHLAGCELYAGHLCWRSDSAQEAFSAHHVKVQLRFSIRRRLARSRDHICGSSAVQSFNQQETPLRFDSIGSGWERPIFDHEIERHLCFYLWLLCRCTSYAADCCRSDECGSLR